MERKHQLILATAAALTVAVAVFSHRGTLVEAPPSLSPSSMWEVSGPTGSGATQRKRSNGAALDRQDVAATCTAYTASVGTELRFAMRATVETGIARPGAPLRTQSVRVRTTGSMILTVAARDAESTMIQCRFPDLLVDVTGATNGLTVDWAADVSRSMRAGFIVRSGLSGATLGYMFPDSTSADHRNWARSLWSAFRFVIPSTTDNAWVVEERDTIGAFTVGYRREGDRLIRRTKTEARLASKVKGSPALRGGAFAELDEELGWLTRVEVDEAISWQLADLGIRARGGFAGTLSLVAARRVPVPALDLSGSWLPESGAAERSEILDAKLRAQTEQRIAGISLDEALANLASMVGTKSEQSPEFVEGLRTLADIIRLRPDRAKVIGDRVSSGSLDGPLAAVALTCLGWADHDAAQSALTSVLDDARLSAEVRESAVHGISELARANPASIDVMRRVLGSADRFSRFETFTMLALGAQAGRNAVDGDGRHSVHALLSQESAARRSGALHGWLEALGNAGSVEALDTARRYLKSDDPTIRAAAVSAVRRVEGSSAIELLTHHATLDPSEEVRARAAEILAGSGSPSSLLVLSRLLHDRSLDVRRAAMEGLATLADTLPAARRTLEGVSRQDPDAELRRYARRLLASS